MIRINSRGFYYFLYALMFTLAIHSLAFGFDAQGSVVNRGGDTMLGTLTLDDGSEAASKEYVDNQSAGGTLLYYATATASADLGATYKALSLFVPASSSATSGAIGTGYTLAGQQITPLLEPNVTEIRAGQFEVHLTGHYTGTKIVTVEPGLWTRTAAGVETQIATVSTPITLTASIAHHDGHINIPAAVQIATDTRIMMRMQAKCQAPGGSTITVYFGGDNPSYIEVPQAGNVFATTSGNNISPSDFRSNLGDVQPQANPTFTGTLNGADADFTGTIEGYNLRGIASGGTAYPGLYGYSNTNGNAMNLQSEGTGKGAFVQLTNVSNSEPGFLVCTYGSGYALGGIQNGVGPYAYGLNVEISSPTNASALVYGTQGGLGDICYLRSATGTFRVTGENQVIASSVAAINASFTGNIDVTATLTANVGSFGTDIWVTHNVRCADLVPTNALALANGGTGATTAAGARTALEVQPTAGPTFTGQFTAANASATGNFQVGISKLMVNTAGNAGIGTATPTSPSGYARVLELAGNSASLFFNEVDTAGNNYEIAVSGGKLQLLEAGSATRATLDGDGSVGIGTGTRSGIALTVGNVASSSIYAEGDITALTFTDRSESPDTMETAYAIVQSHETKDGRLDHSKLHQAAWGRKATKRKTGKKIIRDGKEEDEEKIVSEPDQSGRNISMVISAQALVIKDLIRRIEALEAK